MFDLGALVKQLGTGCAQLSVAQQDAMIAELEAVSRRRVLSALESDALAELLRRAAARRWKRNRRLAEQKVRARRRYERLCGAPFDTTIRGGMA